MTTDSILPDAGGTCPESDYVGTEDFIEQMGLSSQADGLPRIAGRIAGYFIIHGGPVSFTQLAEALQVSRGSISTNTRILLNIGFIEKVGVPGDRQDYYQLVGSPFLRMIDTYLQRMRRMQKIVNQAEQGIPDSMHGAKQRLGEMNRFYREAVRSNELLLRRLSTHQK